MRPNLNQLAALIAVTCLLMASSAIAQTADSLRLESFRPESFGPTATSFLGDGTEVEPVALRSLLATQGNWALGNPQGELQNVDLSLELLSGLSLSRNVQSNVVSVRGALLGTGVRENVTDTLDLSLSPTTRMQFSREVIRTDDLMARMLSGQETRRLGLVQGFGLGDTSGELSLERTWIRKFEQGRFTDWNRQVMGLQAGFGGGYDFAAKLIQEGDGLDFGQERSAFDASLGIPFSGGQGALAFSRARALNGMNESGSDLWKINAPLAMFGGTAQLGHSRQRSFVNNDTVSEQVTNLNLPLPGRIAFTGSFRDVESTAAGALNLSESAWSLETPWLWGQRAQFDTRRMHQAKTGLEQRIAVDNLVLPFHLWSDTGLIEHRLNEEFKNGVMTRARLTQVATPVPLFGLIGDGMYRIRDDITQKDGRIWEKYFHFVLPFQVLSDTSRLSYQLVETERSQDNSWREHETIRLAMPLTSLLKGAELVQSLETYSTGGPYASVSTTNLFAPWRAFGTTGGLRQQFVSFEDNTTLQNKWLTHLTARVNHDTLSLTRESIRTEREGADTQVREMLALQTPRLDVFTRRLTVAGSATQITDTAGADTSKTRLDVQAQPLDRLSILARVESTTQDPGVDTVTQQIISELALFDRVALRSRLDSTTRSDQPDATTLQQFQVRADPPGAGGLGLLYAVTGWGQPGAEQVQGQDLRLSVGNESKLAALTYQVTEYDPDKLQPYQQPLVRVSVAHSRPSSLSLRFALADQHARAATERLVEMGMPALGGNFTLGYAENPLDRHGKNVLLGNRWDASLTRRIMGEVDMKLRYRSYELDEPLFDQHSPEYFALELAGGREERGGKIALGFSQGDFVPQPDPKKPVPGSTLDLSFSRRWADQGRMIITLSHITPPMDRPDQEPQIQGRLEYTTSF